MTTCRPVQPKAPSRRHAAEDAWNTRDPAKVALPKSVDSSGATAPSYRGRASIEAFRTQVGCELE